MPSAIACAKLPDGSNEFVNQRCRTIRYPEDEAPAGLEAAVHPDDLPKLIETCRDRGSARAEGSKGVFVATSVSLVLARFEPVRDAAARSSDVRTSTDIDALKQPKRSCARRTRARGSLTRYSNIVVLDRTAVRSTRTSDARLHGLTMADVISSDFRPESSTRKISNACATSPARWQMVFRLSSSCGLSKEGNIGGSDLLQALP